MSHIIEGKNIIGYRRSATETRSFQAYVPSKDEYLAENFYVASEAEVNEAMNLAWTAFQEYSKTPAKERARFLVAITEEILAVGDQLLERAHLETGLPLARLRNERGRTITQLLQFAELLQEGSWVEASIDTADPNRAPAAKPDLRKMYIPIGPVVVFGSSNFPFAYSVAGVDTGPALAAGNPVIVKAHAAHPGVNDLTAGAIMRAAQRTNMPDGVFSLLYDDGFEAGTQLVRHPHAKAVGFTGSVKGGLALVKIAQERPEPIPVYAEMGSVNPIVILPDYLASQASQLGKTIAGSVTLGAGQFCTNPGLVFTTKSAGLREFSESYASEVEITPPTTMLTAGICKTFFRLREEMTEIPGVSLLATSKETSDEHNQSNAFIAQVSGKTFIAHPNLQEEVFGPYSLLVICEDMAELEMAVSGLAGQLTTSLMGEAKEIAQYPALLQKLSQLSGRIIVRGVPTGVEVCPSMHHGGPFPAASDAKFTSVGRHSILRFVRPQAYQDWDNELLPDELKNENPLGILRLVNNIKTTEII